MSSNCRPILLLLALLCGVVLAVPDFPQWPQRYTATISAKDFYGPFGGTAFYDVKRNMQRWDVEGVDKNVTQKVTRIYDYNTMRQYTLDTPSKNCFWLPLPRWMTSIPTDPMALSLASFVQNDTVVGRKVYKWKVPVAYQRDCVTYIDYFSDAVTGQPVRISGGALQSYDFHNFSTNFSSEEAFAIPSSVQATCAGPIETDQKSTIPWTNWSITSRPYSRLNHLESPQFNGDLGGDGGQTTVLPPLDGTNTSRVYVATDDQMYGVQLHGQRLGFFGPVSNQVLIVTGGSAAMNYTDASRQYFAHGCRSDGSPHPFFRPPASINSRAWTGSGLVVNEGNTMLMLSETNGKRVGTEVWLVHADNLTRSPYNWNVTWLPTPFTQNSSEGMMSAGTVIQDEATGYTYILGHTKGFLFSRHFHLARMPMNDYKVGNFSSIEYYTTHWLVEHSWSRTFNKDSAAKLFDSDAGCSTFYRHERMGIYYALTISASGYVGIAVSKNITGPYFHQTKAFRIPPALSDGFLAYCPSSHPQWAPQDKPNSILFTYVENQFSKKVRAQTSSNSYEDRFVLFDLDGSFLS